MRSTLNFLLPVMALFSGVLCVPAAAQMPTYRVGKPLSAEEIRRWDTGIGPEGKELPPGSGTAKEGKEIWTQKCAQCHGADSKSQFAGNVRPPTPDNNPVLGGEKGVIQSRQFATTIWDVINRYMPLGEGGTLSAGEVYATTAYLLYLEGIIKEDDIMDAKTLPKVRMPHVNDDMSPYKRRF